MTVSSVPLFLASSLCLCLCLSLSLSLSLSLAPPPPFPPPPLPLSLFTHYSNKHGGNIPAREPPARPPARPSARPPSQPSPHTRGKPTRSSGGHVTALGEPKDTRAAELGVAPRPTLSPCGPTLHPKIAGRHYNVLHLDPAAQTYVESVALALEAAYHPPQLLLQVLTPPLPAARLLARLGARSNGSSAPAPPRPWTFPPSRTHCKDPC